jgi:sugar phosphate isomerase/epimerase
VKIVLYVYDTDVPAIVRRCKALDLTSVCLLLDAIPGYQESGVPSAAALRDLTSQLRDAGIEVDSANGATGRNPGVLTAPQKNRTIIDAQLGTLEALGSNGIGTILYYQHFPHPVDADDVPRYWDGLFSFMDEMATQAEATGVRIANHPVWRCLPPAPRAEALDRGVAMEDYPDFRRDDWDGPYLMSSHRDAMRLFEAVPNPSNGICFCTGMHIMGADVPAMAEEFKGRIHHAQIRDVSARWPYAEEVLPGEGEVGIPGALAALKAVGYSGVLGPEHFGEPRWEGDDPERLSVEYLQAQLRAIA